MVKIDKEEVECALKGIKNNKAPGKDGILAEMLKEVGRELRKLTVLTNKCLEKGQKNETKQYIYYYLKRR